MTRPPDLKALAGRYPFIRLLGSGAQGLVYLSKQAALNRQVVVKVLTAREPDALARFEREARLLERVAHPAIAKLVDFGTEAGWTYQVTLYEEGASLADVIRSAAPVAEKEAVALVRQLASALAAVHAAGVVHRDVKPGNVIVTATGLRLIDFGLGFEIDRSRMTVPGMELGTPSHAAPEVLAGEAVGPAADLYALGIILVELLTGQNPFHDPDSIAETVQRQLNVGLDELPETLAKLPPRFHPLARALLQKDPSLRPASAGAVLESLTEKRQRSRRVRQPLRRWRWTAAAMGTLVALLSLVFALMPRGKPLPEASAAAAPAVRLERLELDDAGCATRAYLSPAEPLSARVIWESGVVDAEVRTSPDGGLPVLSPGGARQFRIEARTAQGGVSRTPFYEACLPDALRVAAHRVAQPACSLTVDDLLRHASAAGPAAFAERLERKLPELPAMQVSELLRPYLASRNPFQLTPAVVDPAVVLKVAAALSELDVVRVAARWMKGPVPAALSGVAFPGTQRTKAPAPQSSISLFSEVKIIWPNDLLTLAAAGLDTYQYRVKPPPGGGPLWLSCALREEFATNGYVQLSISAAGRGAGLVQTARLVPDAFREAHNVYVEIHPALAFAPELVLDLRYRVFPIGGPAGKLNIGPATLMRAP